MTTDAERARAVLPRYGLHRKLPGDQQQIIGAMIAFAEAESAAALLAFANPTPGGEEVTQADQILADAVADALAKYAVAYEHFTLADMSTAGRKWRVHETGHGNPFEHGVWLGEFDSKQEANEFCASLRREAAHQVAARHRLAALSTASPGGVGGAEELRDENARLRAENDRLSKAAMSGMLPGLLDDDETTALVDFVKSLRDGSALPALSSSSPEGQGK